MDTAIDLWYATVMWHVTFWSALLDAQPKHKVCHLRLVRS